MQVRDSLIDPVAISREKAPRADSVVSREAERLRMSSMFEGHIALFLRIFAMDGVRSPSIRCANS